MITRVVQIWLCLPLVCLLYGEEARPEELIKGLGSEDFVKREDAQAALLTWTLECRQVALPKILRLFQQDSDPEVRKRALEILKELADADYLSNGQGYLGILMREEPLAVKEGEKLQFGIRILDVMKESPAERADLKIGDLIISLDGKEWQQAGAVDAFSETVAAKKPLMEVVLKINRAQDKPIRMAIKLGRRPISNLQVEGGLNLYEQQVRDQHFEQWLEQKLDE